MKIKNRAILILLVVGMAAVGSIGCASGTISGVTVSAVKAEKKIMKPSTTIEGVLLPYQTADVSSRISGQIASVAVRSGDRVMAGQVLLTLEKHALSAQLSQAEAGMQTAQAGKDIAEGQAELAKINLDAAQKNYDRTDSLFKSGAVSQSQMDEASDRLKTASRQYENASGPSQNQAKASLSTAGANIDNLKVQLDYTVLKSPIDGIVAVQNAIVGETVSVGSSLVTVADTAVLRLKGTVTQDLIPFLKMGQMIPVTVGIYPDKQFQGTLTGIGPMAVSTGEMFPVEVTIQNDSSLMAGLTAGASLETSALERLVIPEASVVQESGKQIVYVIMNGKAVRREVTLGLHHLQDVVVLKGIEEGEMVAVIGSGSLKDQMKVIVSE